MNREVHVRICESRGLRRPRLLDRHGDPSAQHARREQLRGAIRRLFAKHRGTYGSPRITADLRDAGWQVSENTVAAIMAELGLAARRRRRRKQTTRQGRGRWRAPDLVGRQFAAQTLNSRWYGDGTEVPTDQGKLYLDSVLDMASRRIVGFAVGEHHDAALATAALQMAVAVRGGKDLVTGVVFHTDRGVHRWRLPGRLRPVRHQPVHGPGRVRAGQRGHRVLALHFGVRAAQPGAVRHQGPGPAPGRGACQMVCVRSSSSEMRDDCDAEAGPQRI